MPLGRRHLLRRQCLLHRPRRLQLPVRLPRRLPPPLRLHPLHWPRFCPPAPSAPQGTAGAPTDLTRTAPPSAATRSHVLWGDPRRVSLRPKLQYKQHGPATNFRQHRVTALRWATSKPLLSNPGHQSFHCSSSILSRPACPKGGPFLDEVQHTILTRSDCNGELILKKPGRKQRAPRVGIPRP